MEKTEVQKRLGVYEERLPKYRRFVRNRVVEFLNTIDCIKDMADAGILDVTDSVKNLISEADDFLKGLPPKVVEPEQPKPIIKYRVKKEQTFVMGSTRWLNRLLIIHQEQKEFSQNQLLYWFKCLHGSDALKIPSGTSKVLSGKTLEYRLRQAVAQAVTAAVKETKVLGFRKREGGKRFYFIVDLPKLKRLVSEQDYRMRKIKLPAKPAKRSYPTKQSLPAEV